MAKSIIPPERTYTEKGNLVQISVWQVPKSRHYPEGINYSFQLISKGRRVLGFDNNTNEGNHKHFLKNGKLVKEKIEFEAWEKILRIFEKEVEAFEKRTEGGKHENEKGAVET